jgi:hypothetical protein
LLWLPAAPRTSDAQTLAVPSPAPSVAISPSPVPPASDAPAPSASSVPAPAPAALPLPPAGVIPPAVALDVTGAPVADAAFLDEQIRAAIERQVRPTLRPGASIDYGPIVPWPLIPLGVASRATVDVTVSITGDATTAPVTGVTAVTLDNVPLPPASPSLLYLSDDPEYLQSEGLIFRGDATLDGPARLYYYHSDIGIPRDVDVVLTSNAPARAQIIASGAGPDLDVMSVGHAVTRDFLGRARDNEGIVVDIAPGKPLVVRHALILQGEVVAGTVDVRVVSGGAVHLSVVATPAGGAPDAYLGGPRVAYDGHRRHGSFDLTEYGDLAASYTVGDPASAVEYGGRVPTLHNVSAGDDGHDYGDYGVTHRITFTLVNPTDVPQIVYLYEKPLGGPVRASFFIDGRFKELDCVRMRVPYLLSDYQLPPHYTGVVKMETMTDGGSFYPVEIGATDEQPMANVPPIGAPDGCSPRESAFPDPTPGM